MAPNRFPNLRGQLWTHVHKATLIGLSTFWMCVCLCVGGVYVCVWDNNKSRIWEEVVKRTQASWTWEREGCEWSQYTAFIYGILKKKRIASYISEEFLSLKETQIKHAVSTKSLKFWTRFRFSVPFNIIILLFKLCINVNLRTCYYSVFQLEIACGFLKL